jgi:hypothetical protein
MADVEWDAASVERKFRSTATDAYLYLKQCRALVTENPSYERMIDEHTARWEANDYFVGRTFTDSREELLAELGAIRDRHHKPSDVYDLGRYQQHWRSEIDALSARFTGDASRGSPNT